MPRLICARFYLLAVLVVCLLGLSGARTVQAQESPRLASPEEAAVQLKPYVLRSADLPAGYTVTSPSVWTAASLAFFDTQASAPLAALKHIEEEGLVLLAWQSVTPGRGSTAGAVPANFLLYVFLSPQAAEAFVRTESFPFNPARQEVAAVPDAPRYGDTSATFHVLTRQPSGQVSAGFEVRWSRGVVAFQVATAAPLATETTELANALAGVIDARAADVPDVDLSASTVEPPGDETARLQSLLRMRTVVVPAFSVPEGFRAQGPVVLTVAGQVLANRDPASALSKLAGTWQRLAALSTTYIKNGSQNIRLVIAMSEDASAEAAAVDFRDFPNTIVTLTITDAALALGDESILYRSEGRDSQGNSLESLSLAFRHGPLILTVSMIGPAAVPDLAIIKTVAQAVEAAYQQSAYGP